MTIHQYTRCAKGKIDGEALPCGSLGSADPKTTRIDKGNKTDFSKLQPHHIYNIYKLYFKSETIINYLKPSKTFINRAEEKINYFVSSIGGEIIYKHYSHIKYEFRNWEVRFVNSNKSAIFNLIVHLKHEVGENELIHLYFVETNLMWCSGDIIDETNYEALKQLGSACSSNSASDGPRRENRKQNIVKRSFRIRNDHKRRRNKKVIFTHQFKRPKNFSKLNSIKYQNQEFDSLRQLGKQFSSNETGDGPFPYIYDPERCIKVSLENQWLINFYENNKVYLDEYVPSFNIIKKITYSDTYCVVHFESTTFYRLAIDMLYPFTIVIHKGSRISHIDFNYKYEAYLVPLNSHLIYCPYEKEVFKNRRDLSNWIRYKLRMPYLRETIYEDDIIFQHPLYVNPWESETFKYYGTITHIIREGWLTYESWKMTMEYEGLDQFLVHLFYPVTNNSLSQNDDFDRKLIYHYIKYVDFTFFEGTDEVDESYITLINKYFKITQIYVISSIHSNNKFKRYRNDYTWSEVIKYNISISDLDRIKSSLMKWLIKIEKTSAVIKNFYKRKMTGVEFSSDVAGDGPIILNKIMKRFKEMKDEMINRPREMVIRHEVVKSNYIMTYREYYNHAMLNYHFINFTFIERLSENKWVYHPEGIPFEHLARSGAQNSFGLKETTQFIIPMKLINNPLVQCSYNLPRNEIIERNKRKYVKAINDNINDIKISDGTFRYFNTLFHADIPFYHYTNFKSTNMGSFYNYLNQCHPGWSFSICYLRIVFKYKNIKINKLSEIYKASALLGNILPTYHPILLFSNGQVMDCISVNREANDYYNFEYGDVVNMDDKKLNNFYCVQNTHVSSWTNVMDTTVDKYYVEKCDKTRADMLRHYATYVRALKPFDEPYHPLKNNCQRIFDSLNFDMLDAPLFVHGMTSVSIKSVCVLLLHLGTATCTFSLIDINNIQSLLYSVGVHNGNINYFISYLTGIRSLCSSAMYEFVFKILNYFRSTSKPLPEPPILLNYRINRYLSYVDGVLVDNTPVEPSISVIHVLDDEHEDGSSMRTLFNDKTNVVTLFDLLRVEKDKIIELMQRPRPKVIIQKTNGVTNFKKVKYYIRLLSKLTRGGNLFYLELVKSLKLDIIGFLKRITELIDAIEELYITSVFVKYAQKIIDTCTDIIKIFNPSFRRNPKCVWAPLQNSYKRFKNFNELNLILHENPKYVPRSYDETLRYYINHLNACRKDGVEPLTVREYRRRINTNPYIDDRLANLGKELHIRYGQPEGIDGISFSSQEVLKLATARYFDTPVLNSLTDKKIELISDLIVEKFPESYANAVLTKPEKILNKMVRNYSPGIPFFGTYKKRSDIKKDGWYSAVKEVVYKWLENGEYVDQLHHVFPKSQIVQKEKLVANSAKLRTIIAQNMLSYVQTMIFTFDINKRQLWHKRCAAPGMPLTGSAFNYLYDKLDKRKNFFSMDFTAFDANIPEAVIRCLSKIRSKGFKNHPQGEIIEKHFEEIYKSLQRGYLVNLHNEHAKYDEAIFTKRRGLTTGHSNTSEDNSLCLQIIIIDAISEVTGKPIEEFFKHTDLVNFGDDNVVGTDLSINSDDLIKYCKEKHNMILKVEAKGDIYAQEFLSKKAYRGLDFKQDFIDAGIEIPKYAILHNRETLLMRYTGIKGDKSHRALSLNKNFFMLERIIGMTNLTAHQRDLYDIMSGEYDYYLSKMTPKQRANKAMMNKVKFPTYEQVIKNFYKEPKLNNAHMVTKGLFTSLDQLNKDVETIFNYVQGTINVLPVALFDCGDVETGDFDGAFNTDNYDVESFIYLSLLLNQNEPPTREAFLQRVNLSPFKPCMAPNDFFDLYSAKYDSLDDSEVKSLFKYYKQRMFLLSLIYFNLHRALRAMEKVPGINLFINIFNLCTYDLPKVYSFANFIYWLEKGSSSLLISQYIPKDIYINHKRAAVFVLDKIPRGFERVFIFTNFTGITSSLSEFFISLLNLQFLKNNNNILSGNTRNIKNKWTPYIDEILQLYNNNNKVMIQSCTGSGKSFFLPQLLPGSQLPNGTIIQKVIIALPRKILVKELGIPNLKRVNRNVREEITDDIIAGTYGHLDYRKELDTSPSTIWLFDEFHEQSVEMVSLYNKLDSAGCNIMFMSATPQFKVIGKINVAKWISPFEPAHKIEEVEWLGYKEWDAYNRLQKEKPEYAKRVLIIAPHLKKCELIYNTLKMMGHTDFTLVHANQRTIPSTGHIIATQVVDAGINIRDLTCVIDSCAQQVNDRGSAVYRNSDYDTYIQRRGRTGRDCDGLYIALNKLNLKTFINYPNAHQFLNNSEVLSKFYNIDIQIDRFPYSKLNLTNYTRLVDLPLFTENYDSILFYHKIKNQITEFKKCAAVYEKCYKNINDDLTEYIIKERPDNLIPYQELLPILYQGPIVCSINGELHKTLGLCVDNGVLSNKTSGLNIEFVESKYTNPFGIQESDEGKRKYKSQQEINYLTTNELIQDKLVENKFEYETVGKCVCCGINGMVNILNKCNTCNGNCTSKCVIKESQSLFYYKTGLCGCCKENKELYMNSCLNCNENCINTMSCSDKQVNWFDEVELTIFNNNN